MGVASLLRFTAAVLEQALLNDAQEDAGSKHPSGMALKQLAVVQKHGLEVLAC